MAGWMGEWMVGRLVDGWLGGPMGQAGKHIYLNKIINQFTFHFHAWSSAETDGGPIKFKKHVFYIFLSTKDFYNYHFN